MRLTLTALAISAALTAPAIAQSEITPLVDANWLIENAGADNVVILDIRDIGQLAQIGALDIVA
ncbi:MAG: sulfurtransferase, partial [Alphaproteobacteria bacterium]